MLLIVLFLSAVLRYLPQPVLAAIVLMAVLGLFNVAALKHFWRADRAEFVVAMAALLGVLGSGLLRGVLIGAIISLVQLLRRLPGRMWLSWDAFPEHDDSLICASFG